MNIISNIKHSEGQAMQQVNDITAMKIDHQ